MPACRAVLAAALVLAPTLVALAQELPAKLQASFDEGVRALKAGKLDEAEAAFRSVAAKGGGVAYVHNNLGIVHHEGGQHAKAAAEFHEAIRLDPSYVAPRVLLGASLFALGHRSEAKLQLQRAVKLAPREPLARLQLAKAYERGDDWAGAVEQYRVLRGLAPQEPEYAYGLGNAYLRLSEWCLRGLRALDPASARTDQALGHNYRVQNRPDLALVAFERAAEADPTLPDVHLAMAQIHLEQKRISEARREIEKELALLPDSAGARALKERLVALEAASP